MNNSYAVLGGADKIFNVDLKIPGNPPSPKDIIKALAAFSKAIEKSNKIKKKLGNHKVRFKFLLSKV